MKSVAFVIVALLLSPIHLSAEEAEWVSMFNGKSLAGWTPKNGFASYSVVDGTIRGVTAKGSPNSFLCSVLEYGDFELEFEVKVDGPLNSGVQIRSQTRDEPGQHTIYKTGRVNGPQVEIEASGTDGCEAGYVYGEAAGGWLTPVEQRVPHRYFKDDEWNKYRVVARGARIQTFINGQAIGDLTHDGIYQTHAKGFIGLQVHGIGKRKGPFEVRWRNLKIREL